MGLDRGDPYRGYREERHATSVLHPRVERSGGEAEGTVSPVSEQPKK